MVRRTAETFASIAWPFFKICAYSGPFLGEESLTPKCSQILPRAPRPKNILLSGNTRVAYRSSRSVKKCDLSGWQRKQIKEKEKRKQLWDLTSHVFAQTTHNALPSTIVVMWGWVPDVGLANRAKFCENRLRSFDCLRGRNVFSILGDMA